jgi:hypothetical protein
MREVVGLVVVKAIEHAAALKRFGIQSKQSLDVASTRTGENQQQIRRFCPRLAVEMFKQALPAFGCGGVPTVLRLVHDLERNAIGMQRRQKMRSSPYHTRVSDEQRIVFRMYELFRRVLRNLADWVKVNQDAKAVSEQSLDHPLQVLVSRFEPVNCRNGPGSMVSRTKSNPAAATFRNSASDVS